MLGIEQLIIDVIRNEWLVAFALGFLPISEVRGAVIYAASLGKPELIVLGVLGNLAAVPAILALWNLFNIPWWGRKIIGVKLDERIRGFTKQHEKWGFLALAAFVAIPLPVTGVYTGTLIGRLIGMQRRWIFAASVIGVLVSAAITAALAFGFFGLRLV